MYFFRLVFCDTDTINFCQIDIIWNQENGTSNSRRKIIVFLTDEGVHSAGDGAEGGLLTPAGK